MEPKYNNQIWVIFLFSSLTLFNHVTQAIFVASNSIHTTTRLSTASSPQQQPVPPPQTDISSPTPATNQPETDISTPTPTVNPPETDILASTSAANPPNTDISSPSPAKRSLSTLNQYLDQSQGVTNIFHNRDPLQPKSEIKHICESTDYPSLCWPYISKFYSGKSDATTVLEMAINAAARQIKMAQSALANLAKDPKFLSNKKNSVLLDDCKEMYDDALDNLKSAMDAIPKRDLITVNIMLSAALTDFTTCADGFTGKNSPVGGIDNKLHKLVSNCLAISSLVKK